MNVIIQGASLSDLDEIQRLVKKAKSHLSEGDSKSDTQDLPSKALLISDLKCLNLHKVVQEGEILGIVTVNQETACQNEISVWEDHSNPLIIHRKIVHPKHEMKGVNSFILDYVEEKAKNEVYSSVRLYIPADSETEYDRLQKRQYKDRGAARRW